MRISTNDATSAKITDNSGVNGLQVLTRHDKSSGLEVPLGAEELEKLSLGVSTPTSPVDYPTPSNTYNPLKYIGYIAMKRHDLISTVQQACKTLIKQNFVDIPECWLMSKQYQVSWQVSPAFVTHVPIIDPKSQVPLQIYHCSKKQYSYNYIVDLPALLTISPTDHHATYYGPSLIVPNNIKKPQEWMFYMGMRREFAFLPHTERDAQVVTQVNTALINTANALTGDDAATESTSIVTQFGEFVGLNTVVRDLFDLMSQKLNVDSGHLILYFVQKCWNHDIALMSINEAQPLTVASGNELLNYTLE
eukprot:gene33895-41808_t